MRRNWTEPIGGKTRGLQRHQDATTDAVLQVGEVLEELLAEQQRTNELLARMAGEQAAEPSTPTPWPVR